MICIKEGDRYKVCVGNNRYLAGLELGFTEFPIVLAEEENPLTFKKIIDTYQKVEL